MSAPILSAILAAAERSGALLVYASIEGALVIVFVWALCPLIARRAPSLRCALWWAACLKLLVGLSGIVLVSVPLLPAAALQSQVPVVASSLQSPGLVSPSPMPAPIHLPWISFVIGFWIVGALAGCTVTLRQMAKARTVIRRATPVIDPPTSALFADLSRRVGVRRAPELRVSDDVNVPQVVGILAPVVVLPRAHLEGFSEADLAMSLCHELVHVRRKDLWLGWVPALARRIFFFHPAALKADHEYRVAREAACDAEVLRVLEGSASGYGRLLLKMSVSPGGELTSSAAMASPFLDLRRRLHMLEHAQGSRRAGKLRLAAVAALALAILAPVRVVARTSRANHDPLPAKATEHVSVGADSKNAYVFFIDDNTVSMNGSLEEDLPQAKDARGRTKGPLLWFRLGEEAYLLRDARLLDKVRAMRDENNEPDSEQDGFDRMQKALDTKVEKLSQEEEKLSDQIDRLTQKRDELQDRRDDKDEDEADSQDAADLEKLNAEIHSLESRRAEIERALEALSKQQEAVAQEQERIGSENERQSELIDQRIYRLLEESVEAGVAEPVK